MLIAASLMARGIAGGRPLCKEREGGPCEALAGLVNKSAGQVDIWGFDLDRDPRNCKASIGIVPQEIVFDPFFTPRETLDNQAGFYGIPKARRLTDELLRAVHLHDKADAYARSLSGGMKRRLLVAKAMVHSPPVLVLDEPTAGVDVELRRDMWNLVRGLRDRGVTIILTTHYIEEAEEMADRVGVILKGELILVEDKTALMKKLGKKTLTLNLTEVMTTIPPGLADWSLELKNEGHELVYAFDSNADETGVPSLIRQVEKLGIGFKDLNTRQSSLEDIFVSLVHQDKPEKEGAAA
ncbi:MAG: ABC transporter ATP-binding protein [Alphaproteobacteria bacterium]|nr:MAG: ABC transporter ATP-binding protein [Alphaproteobacteria bacterium]